MPAPSSGVRTLRDAGALLGRIQSLGDALAVLTPLGFSADALELDKEGRRALGLASLARKCAVARGSGALRALVVEPRSKLPTRESARAISETLTRTAPHILWLLVVVAPSSRALLLSAWSLGTGRMRSAALYVDLDHVVDSDAETLCALAAVRDSVDVTVHSRWLDILGRDALTSRFYRALAAVVAKMGDQVQQVRSPQAAREIALLYLSRLLFLSFLEAKGWLNGNRTFLADAFNACLKGGGGFQQHVLRPLFFGTLNTPTHQRAARARAFGVVPFLNGGLFSRSPLERQFAHATFPDEAFGILFGELLGRYRFTAREDSSAWSEAAVDPEMLGRAFESLMASGARLSSGAFYTPQSIVERTTSTALVHALAGGPAEVPPEIVECALLGSAPGTEMAEQLLLRSEKLRVVDPCCGSGAFLVHMLERIAQLRQACGDARDLATIRRSVLSTSIFGVDLNPMAVWLCELRLWLSIVIESDVESPEQVPPLPNLDHNIRIGDTLSGHSFTNELPTARIGATHRVVRQRYLRATGKRKEQLAQTLDNIERRTAILLLEAELLKLTGRRLDVIFAARSRDLFGARNHRFESDADLFATLRIRARELRRSIASLKRGGALPFSFTTHFAEVAATGGFSIVAGNPPWVRSERIPPATRALLRQQCEVFRLGGWAPKLAAEKSGSGFAAQVDLAAIFVERSLHLLAPDGILAQVLPAKLWRSLAGSGLRRLLLRDTRLLELDDLSDAPHTFDAVVYPSIVLARKLCAGAGRHAHTVEGDAANSSPTAGDADAGCAEPRIKRSSARPSESRPNLPVQPAAHSMVAAVFNRDAMLRWSLSPEHLALDATPGAPWLIVPGEVRAAFDLLRAGTAPLGDGLIASPRLGVKCGCNNAFIVHKQEASGDTARVRWGSRSGRIEHNMLRPLLRGEGVGMWTTKPPTHHIIWTHDEERAPLRHLPPLTHRWLQHSRRDLSARSDLKDRSRWWMLFRTEASRSDCWRVVWPDIGKGTRAAVLPPSDRSVPLNSCYVALLSSRDDALALAALFNSALSSAWIDVLAEQARGGYRRYLAWTVSLLPLPANWSRAREILAPLGEQAVAGHPPNEWQLLQAVLAAYDLQHEDVAPLLSWYAR